MDFRVGNFKKLPDEKRLVKYLFEKVANEFPTSATIREGAINSNVVSTTYNADKGVLTATISPTIVGTFLDILIEADYPNGEKRQWIQTIETLIIGVYPYEPPLPPVEDNVITLYYSDGASVLANLTFPATPTVLDTTFN
jgi:hypothetical protein